MFQDEVGFGRWWTGGQRPAVSCHHIREHRYVYGTTVQTACMNTFLDILSSQYSLEHVLLICDGVVWHKSKTIVVPDNFHLLHIPQYTPQMNSIEQIWREIRTCGFRNEVFKTQNDVIDRLTETIKSITPDAIRSITGCDRILEML